MEKAIEPIKRARVRMYEVLRRHVRAEDLDLSDDAAVRAMWRRYESARGDAVLDPAE